MSQWIEPLLPLGMVGLCLCVAGTSLDIIHKLFYGKPKHPCHDSWDRAMDERDARLLAEYREAKRKLAASVKQPN